jgi:hypothetical protein
MIDWKQKRKELVASLSDLPTSVLSLHVDHGLQSDTTKMARAAKATATATAFKAAHSELCIPWGEPPFPSRLHTNGAIESVACMARYRLMFDAMV